MYWSIGVLMAIMQKILFVIMMFALLAVTFYSLEHLQNIYLEMNNIMIRIGVVLIFTSILSNVQRQRTRRVSKRKKSVLLSPATTKKRSSLPRLPVS